MRVCQFRHFGTGHGPGSIGPTGSNLSLTNAALCVKFGGLRLSAGVIRVF